MSNSDIIHSILSIKIGFSTVCLILLFVVNCFFIRKYIKRLKQQFWQTTYYPESADCYICGIGKAYIDCDINHLKEKA